MIKAIYFRYGFIEETECETIEKAKDLLDDLEMEGEGYATCIYDENGNTAYIAENMQISGRSKEDIFNDKLDDLKKIGIEPLKIEFYTPFS